MCDPGSSVCRYVVADRQLEYVLTESPSPWANLPALDRPSRSTLQALGLSLSQTINRYILLFFCYLYIYVCIYSLYIHASVQMYICIIYTYIETYAAGAIATER